MKSNQKTGAMHIKYFHIPLWNIHCTGMKGVKAIGMICGVLLACLLGMLVPAGREQLYAQAKILTQGSENYRYLTYQVGEIEVKIHVGLSGNMVRSERYAPVHLKLKNDGEDFEGIFRMYLNNQDDEIGNRNVLEKKIQIAAGETKEYSWLCPNDYTVLQTFLCNKKGKPLNTNHLDKQILALNKTSNISTLFGSISEDNSSLTYLIDQEDNQQIEPLQDWMLTGDVRTLDIFDVLVINQFDTTQFSEKQIAAINDWVRQGGTLIFGTGVQPEKTLKAFSGTLLQGTIGNVKKISTSYGTDLDISELQIENMESILNEGDDMLVGQMDYGKGSVIVATFDLAGVGDKPELASNLQSLFYTNVSIDQKNRLFQEQYRRDLDFDYGGDDLYGEFSLKNGLRATEVNGLPNIALYAVILLLYAIFIGPVLYSVLRKRGKREWLWKLIPISAVVCSVLIYLIGTGTRVRHPYINYLSQMDWSNEAAPSMQTYMMLTSPNNDPFEWEISEKDIVPYQLIEQYYSVQYGNSNNSVDDLDYEGSLEYLDDKTILRVQNLSAFDNLMFRQRQEIKQQGRIQFSDLSLTRDALSGIVTNQSEYDLEQCVIICNGEILLLGDLKRGESISLNQLDVSLAWVQDVGIDSEIAAKVIGYDNNLYNNHDIRGLRRTALLNRYYNLAGEAGGYYFYGFLASDQSTAYMEQYDADLYGETGVMQQLSNADLGEVAADQLGTLDVFAEDPSRDFRDATSLSIAEYKVTYDLKNAGASDLLQLRYQNFGNKEFDFLDKIRINPADTPYIDGQLFLGKVYAVNRQTGKKELLFTAGMENIVTDLGKYMDKQQKLELIYQIEGLDAEQYPNQYQNQEDCYDSLGLPRLVLERRNEQ